MFRGDVRMCDACDDDCADAGPLWQGERDAGTAAVVLECVFAALEARELWACGRVCRAWRCAAAAPALWRRQLLPAAAPSALRALSALAEHCDADGMSEWSWRKEYALEIARWDVCEQLLAPGACLGALLCAALHKCGTYLAVVDDDARLTIYEYQRLKSNQKERDSEWTVRWSDVVKTEWRSISFAQWAPHATSLLLGGRLALVDRFELLCINFDDEWRSKVVCRSGSGPGGAGCWVDDCNFLSMRLQLLAPGHACTTVWLNAASQETYSEFAGVTAPLLRIYNESATHISHILVAKVPKTEDFHSNMTELSIDDVSSVPTESYYNKLQGYDLRKGDTQRILVAAGGVAGGPRGQARALLAWRLPTLQVPVLWVEDHLAQRVQRHRLRLDAGSDAENDPDREPDAELMRALCTAPAASCNLSEQIIGIILHPRGACVWATTTSGAACVSLPQLTPLLRLPRNNHCGPMLSPHYVLPAVDDDYFVTPVGAGAGSVRVWAARTARAGAQLQHSEPALAVFMLPRRARRRRLLVLTANNVYLWGGFLNTNVHFTFLAGTPTHTGMASLRICSRHIHIAQPNKLSLSGTHHHIKNCTGSIKDVVLVPPLQKFPTILSCQPCATVQSKCYELLPIRLSSTCGATSTNKSKPNTKVDNLSSILSERSQHKEAARGRDATTTSTKQSNSQDLGGGTLDLQVPPSTEKVRVRVSLDFNSSNLHKMKPDSTVNAVKFTACDKSHTSPKTDSKQKSDKSKLNPNSNPCAPKPRKESSTRCPPTACPPCKPKTKFTLIPGFPVIY